MYRRDYFLAVLGAICLIGLPPSPALAHGEFDEEDIAEFHLHMDDFSEEVDELTAELEPIVAAHARGEDTAAAIDAYIDHWEDAGVHAAIEIRATVTYPNIWQAIIVFQRTVGAGGDDAAVAAAAEQVKSALWQGFGALRLAASQVDEEAAPTADAEPPASGPETVDRIVSDLEDAVAAYEDDDLERAETLIHRSYMDRFEGLEGDLIARDPELVASLEQDFNATLPLLMQQGASLDRVNEALATIRTKLERARDILRDVEGSRSEVF